MVAIRLIFVECKRAVITIVDKPVAVAVIFTFIEDQIPNAVIRFKQGVGRLIRSTTDTGRVIVLDPRIVTKGYGRKFLDALPEGVLVEELPAEDN